MLMSSSLKIVILLFGSALVVGTTNLTAEEAHVAATTHSTAEETDRAKHQEHEEHHSDQAKHQEHEGHLSKKEQKRQKKKEEREEARQAVPILEATVHADKDKVVRAVANLADFQQQLQSHWNSSQTQAQATKMAHDAHMASEHKRQALHAHFNAARQAAEEFSADTNKTVALSNMGNQLQLMELDVKALHKLNHHEGHDARHRRDALQSKMRRTASHLHKEARKTLDEMKHSAKKLDRSQRKAGLSEHTQEGMQLKNELTVENLQDHIENLADDIQDQIDRIGDRIEDPLDAAVDKAHHANQAMIHKLRHQQQAVSEMVESTRRQVKMTQHTDKHAHLGVSLSSEASTAAVLAALAGILGGAAGFSVFFIYHRLRSVHGINTKSLLV